jgi:hypothetical protein
MNVILNRDNVGGGVICKPHNGTPLGMFIREAQGTPPLSGLLAEILFESGDGSDTSGNGFHFAVVGSPSVAGGVFTSVNAGGYVSDYFHLDTPVDEITGKASGQEYVRIVTAVRVPSGAGLIEAYPVGCRTYGGVEFKATWGLRVIDNGGGTMALADFYFSLDGTNFTSTFSAEFAYDTWTVVEAYLHLADPGNSNNVTAHIRIDGGSWNSNPSAITWLPTTSPGCQIGAANEQSYGVVEIDTVRIYNTAP